MSEPTYRVELTHQPEETWPWRAAIYRVADDGFVKSAVDLTREKAFDVAQEIVRSMLHPEAPSTVYLTEDGDILDPHEVQR